MRQRPTIREHFSRGNARSQPDCRSTMLSPDEGTPLASSVQGISVSHLPNRVTGGGRLCEVACCENAYSPGHMPRRAEGLHRLYSQRGG